MHAQDPVSTNDLPAGIHIGQTATVFAAAETNTTNNIATATTKTIGMDLTVSITGTSEGLVPGTTPGSDMNYTLTIHSRGTTLACANWVDIHLATGTIPADPLLITETPLLTTDLGQPAYFVDPAEEVLPAPTITATDV